MSRHKYRKFYDWSPNLAYAAGLLASDGCLSGDGRHINLTSKDAELINITQKILNLNAKVTLKKGGFNTYAHSLQFSDVALFDFLCMAGIKPAKSKSIKAVSVDERYYADFLRGYFDGDGTIYGYQDKRWVNSYMYYIGYTSASKAFLEWLQKLNSKLAHTSQGSIRNKNRALTLEYAKDNSRILFKYMYYSPGVPKLTRKYQKFVDFLKSDPYSNIVT
jgi:intein/homing endonuclease